MYKITSVNPKIFRGYDIRGIVDEDLSADVYYTLGRAYGTFLNQRRIKETAVGRDNRLSSDEYSAAFIAGLNDAGINTFDIGMSMSQIVYFSSYHFKTKGGAMITASHNPKEFNGLKLGVGYSDTMLSEELQQLRQMIEDGKLDESEKKGTNEVVDIFPEYKKDILKHFHLKKNWKIVVDCSNTTSGMFYPEIFRDAGCEVIEQNTELDGNFPSGTPDPTEVEVLERLAEGVKHHKSDIGFAYDTDGDRMSVVDEKGRVFWMDSIVAIFAKDVLETMPGASIIYNTLCSRQVQDTVKEAGGNPVIWKTGHSYIKAKVKEERAPFGGELSGHIFFMDNFYGHDDGAYACMRLLQYLEKTGKTLGEVADTLPEYISSPEIKFGLADEIKFQFIDEKIQQEFKALWPHGDYVTIDGVRVDTPDHMSIIRASQNGPYITVKFEAKTQEKYDEIKKTLKDVLKKHPEVEWDKGVNTSALD